MKMPHTLLAMMVVLISAMVLALRTGAPVMAAQEMGSATATLTGAAEVPGPGDPQGSGSVQVTLDPNKGEECYELRVENIQEATAAHIHEGAVGEGGSRQSGPGYAQNRLYEGVHACGCPRDYCYHAEA